VRKSLTQLRKDDQGMEEEGTHIPLTKEPQGSVKGKIKPREERGTEESQENGEVCGTSEGGQNNVVQALVQSKRPHRLHTNRSEDFLWVAVNKKLD
jgi:hypothetical protein